MGNDTGLPPHVEETVRAVEQLHVTHHESASSLDRLLERIRAFISHPSLVGATVIFIAAWIGINLYLRGRAFDPPPFAYLSLFLSFVAVYVTILILATQRRADGLAGHREQLILQLGFVSEQRSAKIIALLEELRRDSPQIRDRVDPEAQQMTERVDPDAVSEALREIEVTVTRQVSR
jgi:uncharacterized membrane protein